jgi:hypothetical protein
MWGHMYDPTIHARTIARHFRPHDFIADPSLLQPQNVQNAIDQAVAIGRSGFGQINLRSARLRGSFVHRIEGIAENLVLRHITRNIRRVTSVKQDDRQFIVSCIRTLLQEGTPFRVYKFDVKSFYESVLPADLLRDLASDLAFSGQSVRALKSLFDQLHLSGVVGLPRGMAISATLAEYLMRPFDRTVSEMPGVWYYSRFVDDMLFITDAREDIIDFVDICARTLPYGLHFNAKSRLFDFVPFNKSTPKATEHRFSFLGYEFDVSTAYRGSDNRIHRDVNLDIAPAKVAKLKTRIAKSLITYRQDNHFYNLRDRMRVLTGNFNFVDRTTGVRRTSGIYFNYPLIDGSTSRALPTLDAFLRKALTASRPENRLYPTLTPHQRTLLLGLSFTTGHNAKRFFSFRPERLAQLTACWHYA